MLLFSLSLPVYSGMWRFPCDLSYTRPHVWEALPAAMTLSLLSWSFLQLPDPQSSTSGLGGEGSAGLAGPRPPGPHTPFPVVDVDDDTIGLLFYALT